MTLPTSDNFADRELSIEDLEAIAAGFIVAGATGMGHPPPPPRPRPGWLLTGALYVVADLKFS